MAYDKSYNDNALKAKVTNAVDARVDYHDNLSREDIEWIILNPNLHVDVLEVRATKRRSD